MHGEYFTVNREVIKKLITAKRVIAVGTTSLRTLESIYWLGLKLQNGLVHEEWELEQWEVYKLAGDVRYQDSLQAILDWMDRNSVENLYCRTSLLIVPGYQFKIPVGLVTNFHQPQSTLLFLIAAFIGENWKKVYQHALDNGYRFLSYGDSSLLWRHD